MWYCLEAWRGPASLAEAPLVEGLGSSSGMWRVLVLLPRARLLDLSLFWDASFLRLFCIVFKCSDIPLSLEGVAHNLTYVPLACEGVAHARVSRMQGFRARSRDKPLARKDD